METVLFTVLTLYPEMFPGPLGFSLAGKALAKGRWLLEVVDIRDFARRRDGRVDDAPFGGGAGMVLRPDVLAAALDSVRPAAPPRKLVYFTPRGRLLDQGFIAEVASGGGAVLVCGRFEGVDQRLIEARGLIEISLGDFVLSGGEIAAMALIDAVVRTLPGVIGEASSLAEESFAEDLLEYPHYTRPREWEGLKVPAVLLSGDHRRIRAWRRAQAEELTRSRRPDLWRRHLARALEGKAKS